MAAVENLDTQDNNSLAIPVIEVTEPGDNLSLMRTASHGDNPSRIRTTSHGDNPSHIRTTSHNSKSRFAIKLQVSEPPSASKKEVFNARQRLTSFAHRQRKIRNVSS